MLSFFDTHDDESEENESFNLIFYKFKFNSTFIEFVSHKDMIK